MFQQIYYNICERGRQLKEQYGPKSGLHQHHIIPKHSGGTDDSSNLTYLTVREHIICHYLLWKIHRNPNDLRSMKMLGAKLTPEQRSVVGKWCRDNEVGFHGRTKSERLTWSSKGVESQKQEYEELGIKNFYYWSTPEGRKERASLGGKMMASDSFRYWASPEGRKERASKGGKALKGRKVMTNPETGKWHRVKPEEVEEKLTLGWVFGIISCIS